MEYIPAEVLPHRVPHLVTPDQFTEFSQSFQLATSMNLLELSIEDTAQLTKSTTADIKRIVEEISRPGRPPKLVGVENLIKITTFLMEISPTPQEMIKLFQRPIDPPDPTSFESLLLSRNYRTVEKIIQENR